VRGGNYYNLVVKRGEFKQSGKGQASCLCDDEIHGQHEMVGKSG
jgi:hypothetical protein